jgi:hypothetical protein
MLTGREQPRMGQRGEGRKKISPKDAKEGIAAKERKERKDKTEDIIAAKRHKKRKKNQANAHLLGYLIEI